MHYPEKGFYYHYKHDPAKGVNDYAYEVTGFGHHTEIPGDNLDDSAMAMYLPLYDDCDFYIAGKHHALRPLKMFMDKNFEKDGKIIPERFIKITDEKVISELIKIRDEMYK